MCMGMCALNNAQMLAVHHEETEDSALEVGVFLHGQLKEWNNYIIKGIIIWWTETCSLYWTLRSYSTFVYWCTQIKGKVQIRVVRKFCIAVHSGKMSISYFENKGVLLSPMAKMLFLLG